MGLTSCIRFIAVVFFIYIGLLPRLLSQEEILYFDHFSTSQGLIANTYNYCVSRDSRGFIWVSSLHGLIRYDGIEGKPFLPDEDDPHSLSDPNVQSPLFEDRKGRLWFNTANNIHYYDPNREHFQQVPVFYEKEKAYSDFQVVHYDSLLNNIWFFGEENVHGKYFPLYTMNVDNTDEPLFLDSIPKYLVEGMKVIHKPETGRYYLTVPQRDGWEIRCYEGGERISVQSFPISKTTGYTPFFFHLDQHDCLWVGTSSGLVLTNFSGSEWHLFDSFEGKMIEEVRGIAPYDSSRLIVATEKMGLFLFDIQKRRYTHSISSTQGGYVLPFRNSIMSMYLDEDRNLWISTSDQGIFYTNLNKKRFDSYLQRRLDSTRNYNIKSITEGPNGEIWHLTNGGIVITDKKGRILPKTAILQQRDTTLKGKETYFIYCDRLDNIWVCANSGIHVLLPGQKQFTRVCEAGNDMCSPVITYVNELTDGTLLASSYSEGVFQINRSGYNFSLGRPVQPVDTSGAYTVIYEDRSGRIYAYKVRTGIKIFDRGPDTLILRQTIPFNPLVHVLAESPDSTRIWVGSSQGLYWLDKQQDTFSLHKESVFSAQYPVLNGLIFDDSGSMWISTTRGLALYNPTEKELGHLAGTPQNRFRIFGIADGLQEFEFNFWSFCKTKDQQLVFGGVNGFSLFNPGKITPYPIEARPVINKILINGEPLEGNKNGRFTYQKKNHRKRLKLNHTARTLSLYFASMEYGHTGFNQFQYYLKKADGGLINSGTDNFASYVNLSPGKYMFELYASNTEKVWSEKPYLLPVFVRPHWSETWWFYGLIFLTIIGGLYLVYRNRIERARKQQQLAELETAILRVQMNPHFIFNSLNSILSYIREKDVDTADDYLMHLAGLMRKILNTADRPFTSIYQERQLLEEYMKVEALRFDNAFSSIIEIPDDLDPYEVVIPTMILQPFVENSIIHGFKGRKSAGLITIKFWIVGTTLHCLVRDNGVGRKTAGQSPKTHKSKALEITQKRLLLIEEQTGKSTSLEILDLSDPRGFLAGTEVHISMPVL